MLRSAFLCASALLVLLASFACANVQTESKIVNGHQSVESQQKQIADTILNKGKLSEEITQKFASFREGCYPRPNQQGCRCVERDVDGHDLEKLFDTDGQCKVVSAQEEQRQLNETILNKGAVNEELKQKFSTPFRDGCFPRPNKSGCRCVEKDMDGHDQEKLFDTEAECTVSAPSRVVRAARVQQERVGSDVAPVSQDRTQQKTAGTGVDPVAERARQNYAAVLNELKNKFAGLREGCYPRPKGCLCVIGKDATGREITERRMNDADCKCRPGERSRDCPARGA